MKALVSLAVVFGGAIYMSSCVDDPCDPDPCSGHGTCSDGTCACDTGYAGASCNQCAVGYIGYPNCVDDPCDPDSCSGHGICSDGTCACDTGYAGEACDVCDPAYSDYPDCDQCSTDALGEYPYCFLPSDTFCETSQCFLVPPTNQSQCYDNSAVMTCTSFPCNADGRPDFCGQDAQYPDNVRTYTCYSAAGGVQDPCDLTADLEEVVTDSLTGLMWQRTWEEGRTWQQALDYCESLDYGGQQDWRLPNIFELQSIVDDGRQNPVIDTAVFPGTPSEYFWSSSSRANSPTDAWFIPFSAGYVSCAGKSSALYVRCVRPFYIYSGSGGGTRFNVYEPVAGEQVVYDVVAGLMWQKSYATGKTWQQALYYCEGLTHGGHSDWRLPDKKEIMSLVNYAISDPASDFPDMPSIYFWSSNTSFPTHAWYVDFHGGSVSYMENSYPGNVRCVRPGP